MTKSKHQAPRRLNEPQLAKVGLRLISREPLIVQCATCGVEWRPVRLRRIRWWQCHNGCNVSHEK
jgi:hypothetical protein